MLLLIRVFLLLRVGLLPSPFSSILALGAPLSHQALPFFFSISFASSPLFLYSGLFLTLLVVSTYSLTSLFSFFSPSLTTYFSGSCFSYPLFSSLYVFPNQTFFSLSSLSILFLIPALSLSLCTLFRLVVFHHQMDAILLLLLLLLLLN